MVFIPALLGGLITVAGSLVGRVILSLGVGFVTYQGVSATISTIEQIIISNATSAGGYAVAALALMQFDTAVGIILGAISARLLINGLTSGTLRKMVFK